MNTRFTERAGTGLALAAVLSLATVMPAPAHARADISISPASYLWDPSAIVGTSKLVRTDTGISANFQVEDMPPGHAITLWFVIFNNPAACAGPVCGPADLLLDDAAEADFLFAGGNIVGNSGRAGFAGHLNVGDDSRSAFYEIGMPERALGLTNPRGAEVHLLLHTHGPAVPELLPSQINSFLGGCAVFLGDGFGLATGPGDIPDDVGECVTFVGSGHF